MKLFLCSSFITPDIQNDFETLIDKPTKGLKVACITTASSGYIKQCESKGEKADLSWMENDIKSAIEYFECSVDTFDIEKIPQSKLKEVLSKYEAIWMEGGMTIYLMKAILSTGFDSVLRELLQSKVYVGSSAGSMVCSKSLDATGWYIGDPEENPERLKGLGLVDFQIYPHFNPKNLEEIEMARHLDQEYWLLKDGQAVAINDKIISECGGEIIKLYKLANS